MFTIIIGTVLLSLIAVGIPISFSLGLASMLGIALWLGVNQLMAIALGAWTYGTLFAFAVLPLSIIMTELITASGSADYAFTALSKWVGRFPGSLAIATIGACAIFAAACSSSAATAATIGKVAIPEMLNRGYDKRLATGVVAAGGTLGILIPPSGVLILYGILTQQSIGALFIAGIIPGVMMSVIFGLYCVVRCKLDPTLAPAPPQASWSEKWAASSKVWPVLMLIVGVLGSIYTGVATPTEAAGIGAFIALGICLAFRRRTIFPTLHRGLMSTAQTTSFVFFIVIGAMSFGFLLTTLRVPQHLSAFVISQELSPWTVFIIVQILFLVLGFFLDPASINVLTVPVLFPLIKSLGFDPVWFGITMVMNMEMANLTPPFGVNFYVVKGIAPPNVTLTDVVLGSMPFVALLAFGIAMVAVFPQLALWLPSLMK